MTFGLAKLQFESVTPIPIDASVIFEFSSAKFLYLDMFPLTRTVTPLLE